MLLGRPPRAGGLLVLASLVALTGCSSYRSPRITLGSVSVTEVTNEALAIQIDLELQNPNTIALGLDELRYSITVDGTLAYVGRRATGRTLSGLETRLLTLPGVINFKTIGWSPSSGPRQVRYTVTGTLWYQTPSEIAQLLFDTGMRRPKVTFGEDGQMTLPAAD